MILILVYFLFNDEQWLNLSNNMMQLFSDRDTKTTEISQIDKTLTTILWQNLDPKNLKIQ